MDQRAASMEGALVVWPSSSMDAPFVQGGYANSMMPHFNLLENHSGMAAPSVPRGYTSLLMGVDQIHKRPHVRLPHAGNHSQSMWTWFTSDLPLPTCADFPR